MFPDRDAARWYLAALIDGEGYVGKRKHKGKKQGFTREVRITNTNESIIHAGQAALDLLGVNYKTYKRTDRAERENVLDKHLFDIVVSNKEGMDIILAEVPLQCDYKRERLRESQGSYVRKHRPSLEILKGHMDAGLSDAKIGALYGVTGPAVWGWRKHYGLERTIQVKFIHKLAATLDAELSTEVIIEDDADIRDAGRDAGRVLTELLAGIGESTEEEG